jgi:hypothetical protein
MLLACAPGAGATSGAAVVDVPELGSVVEGLEPGSDGAEPASPVPPEQRATIEATAKAEVSALVTRSGLFLEERAEEAAGRLRRGRGHAHGLLVA